VGGLTFFKDLSVSMLGDDARFAARECTELARSKLIRIVSRRMANKYIIPFFFLIGAVFAIVIISLGPKCGVGASLDDFSRSFKPHALLTAYSTVPTPHSKTPFLGNQSTFQLRMNNNLQS
jgi:hypothetical protein